mmetsp:Transcript_16537/g.16393  ORF Transcript_16537/g.16393 Transcript_16537/m.16393 type:complete len:114 (-) Transcript_16537:153-494(-)
MQLAVPPGYTPSWTLSLTTHSGQSNACTAQPAAKALTRWFHAGERLRGYKYDNIWNSIRSILAKDGVFGFYRGVFVSLVRVMPAQWCTFVTYECVKDAILRYQEANCSSHELE